MTLDNQDLALAVRRLPRILRDEMSREEWRDKVFVGGGYIRAIVSGEPINDVDIFISNKEDARRLAKLLAKDSRDIIETDNAITIKSDQLPMQIIHRWVFEKGKDVSLSFDFTICCGVIWVGKDSNDWKSFCDDRFYIDLAAKRLVYRNPSRNEDAGGSMLRVLKYYQKGYRIPLDSLGSVISRLVSGVRDKGIEISNQGEVAKVLTGLLREVDPSIDPLHRSHFPTSEDTIKI